MLAVGVLERDSVTRSPLFAWRYPDIEIADEKVILARSGLERDDVGTMFTFSKFSTHWFYIWTIAKPALEKIEVQRELSFFVLALYSNGG
jgi:hypothetical protein